MSTIMQRPITLVPVLDTPIPGLLTAYRDERQEVIISLDTVEVAVLRPKPDEFPPVVVYEDNWLLLVGCVWILAFVYFTVLLYLFSMN